MAYIFIACIAVAYIIMAYKVMSQIAMAFIVIAHIVMAYIVIAYIIVVVIDRIGAMHAGMYANMCIDSRIALCTLEVTDSAGRLARRM